jgi:hypothetical protein
MHVSSHSAGILPVRSAHQVRCLPSHLDTECVDGRGRGRRREHGRGAGRVRRSHQDALASAKLGAAAESFLPGVSPLRHVLKIPVINQQMSMTVSQLPEFQKKEQRGARRTAYCNGLCCHPAGGGVAQDRGGLSCYGVRRGRDVALRTDGSRRKVLVRAIAVSTGETIGLRSTRGTYHVIITFRRSEGALCARGAY